MVSKPANEGQATATGNDVAVRSSRLRVPSQRRPCRHRVSLRTPSSSAFSSRVPAASSGTVRVLQRRAPASRGRCGRRIVVAGIPVSSGSDRRRRVLLGGGTATDRLGSYRRPSPTCTRSAVTTRPIAVTHRQRISRQTETSGSRDTSARCDVIVQDHASRYNAAVSAVQTRHRSSVKTPEHK